MSKLRENESEDGSVVNRLATNYAVVLTPTDADVTKTEAALNNIDYYGMYVSNLRNTKINMQSALEKEFGPSIPSKKKALEKINKKPFPPKTKQAIDDFIKAQNPGINLLKWIVKGDEIIFPKDGNPAKEVIKNIVKVVMGNAKINYKISEKEINENKMKKGEFKQIVREEIAKLANEPKKNIDKISDVIVQIRSIQQQTFKTKPKAIAFLDQAVKALEQAQNIV